ncbi:MAG: MurR/RpiR family transcriptional regulator [Eubacteriales bacterium]
MIITLTKEILKTLSKTELEIVKFINDNEAQMAKLSIVDIAEETFSSPSTVSRAIRKCGLNGFNELRHRLTVTNENQELQHLGEIMDKSVIEARNLVERISVNLILEIAKEILNAKRIYVLTRGPTDYVGEEFSFKLQLLDMDSMSINDPNIMLKKSLVMGEGDLTIIFSLNGGTPELIESAKNIAGTAGKVVSCCCNEYSELATVSDYFVEGYRHQHIAIKDFEVSSRVSLYMISRIITDYLVGYKNGIFKINENPDENL